MFESPTSTIACIAAHPDDEVLMAGGSIARHVHAGQRVHILIVASGLDSRVTANAAEHSNLRANAASAAAKLGADAPRHLGLPDNALDSLPLLQVIKPIEDFISETRPTAVYTHHRGDLNIDHRVVHDAVLVACRMQGNCPVQRILTGETLSSSEWQSADHAPFRPSIFHDISTTIDKKVLAMEAYEGEIRSFPHPRSTQAIRALATLRGSTVGFNAAEAFMLVR